MAATGSKAQVLREESSQHQEVHPDLLFAQTTQRATPNVEEGVEGEDQYSETPSLGHEPQVGHQTEGAGCYITTTEHAELLALRHYKATMEALMRQGGSPQVRPPPQAGVTPPTPDSQVSKDAISPEEIRKIIREEMKREKAAKGKPVFSAVGPFKPGVMDQVLPPGVGLPPNLGIFTGSGKEKPEEHLQRYVCALGGVTSNTALWCRFFAFTLTGSAMEWFRKLPANSIGDFDQLASVFLAQYADGMVTSDSRRTLAELLQKHGETLRSFWSRFNEERRKYTGFPETEAVAIFKSASRSERLREVLIEETPVTLEELRKTVYRAINYEESRGPQASSSSRFNNKPSTGKRPWEAPNNSARVPTRHPLPVGQALNTESGEAWPDLKVNPKTILDSIADQPFFCKPFPIRDSPSSREYCKYHRVRGHDTDKCRNLLRHIRDLIGQGYLGEFVARAPGNLPTHGGHKKNKGHSRPSRSEVNPIRETSVAQSISRVTPPKGNIIATITCDLPAKLKFKGEDSARPFGAVLSLTANSKRSSEPPSRTITFSDVDYLHIRLPHNDALVIQAYIGNNTIRRVLVDTGASIDIMTLNCFRQLHTNPELITPVSRPIRGFGDNEVMPEGAAVMNTILGDLPGPQSHIKVDYLLVDTPSAYNIIIGRPTLNSLRAVPSTAALKLKWWTPKGIAVSRGDQEVAQACHLKALEIAAQRPPAPTEPGPMAAGSSQVCNDTLTILLQDNPELPIKIGNTLGKPLQEGLIALLTEFRDVFAYSPEEMPGIDPAVAHHTIPLFPGARPVHQKRRNMAGHMQTFVKAEVDKLRACGFIKDAKYSQWVSNVVVAPKANGKLRMCVDFKRLNKCSPKDTYPLPKIDGLITKGAGCKLLSFMDAFSGYHQIPMSPADIHKTTFCTEHGLYSYTRMPFGLINAGATYQRFMNTAFHDQIDRNLVVYVDDLMVYSREEESHLADLRESFEVMRKYSLKLNPEKCKFGLRTGKFLGYIITERGVEADPEKVQAILAMPPPGNKKEIGTLTGRLVFISRFISRYSDRCAPLFLALKSATPKGEISWNPTCQEAFENIKGYLANPPYLIQPAHGEPLHLYIAATDKSLSSVLVKLENQHCRPVYYCSKRLQGAEVNYPKLEKLILAVVHTSRKLKQYFEAHPITVLTDQPLGQALAKPESSSRLPRWSIELSSYGVVFGPRPAMKGQVLADFLVECDFTRDDQETPKAWRLFVDGSSNSGGAGAGLVFISPEGIELEYSLTFGFPASNNVSEYEALLSGLRIAFKLGATCLDAYTDSQLVAKQFSGEYETREPTLVKYLSKLRTLAGLFPNFTITHIPRGENSRADALSKLGSTKTTKSRTIYMEELQNPSVEEVECLHVIDPTIDWASPIIQYLQTGILPGSPTEALRIQHRSKDFCVQGGVLYKRGYLLPLLRCVRTSEVGYVLGEVHEGICGSHAGIRSLENKVRRMGYFWPTMRSDILEYVRRCESCQIHSREHKQRPMKIKAILEAWPFMRWGLDILGPFPTAAGQLKFIVVAVDYFSKWIEAQALATITSKKIQKFLLENVIYRYGAPRFLVTDNGKQFDNEDFRNFCKTNKIRLNYASVAHPQTNGQVEAMNKSVKEGIKKKLGASGTRWPDVLPEVLWSLRTTPSKSTGETPFSLVYGTEAVIPVELGLPTARTAERPDNIHDDSLQNDEAMRATLDGLGGIRSAAYARMAVYQQRVARYHNSRVKPRKVVVGDYVLRKREAAGEPATRGKLEPNWKGPFKVIEDLGNGAYRLSKLKDGEERPIPRTWNMDNLRKFHP